MAPHPYESVADLMDPELRNIIEAQKKPDRLIRPTKANITKMRPGFDALSARWHSAPIIVQTLKTCRAQQPWAEDLIKIPCRDGYGMPTEVFKPQGQNTDLPLILLVHGGAGCMGGLGTDRFIAQLLCSRLRAVVVSIEYRLIPEVKFTVPSEDVYDAMSWVQQSAGKANGGLEGVNLEKGYVVCGVSAGGNMLGTALVWAAEEKLKMKNGSGNASVGNTVPKPTSVIMLMTGFPVEGFESSTGVSVNLYPDSRPSFEQFNEAPICNKHVNPVYNEISDGCDIESSAWSALNIPKDSPVLDFMPPVWYHQTAGLDMWRDTTLLWFSLLLHGKAEPLEIGSYVHTGSISNRPVVKIDHFPGLPHSWWSAYPQVSMTPKWIESLVNGAKWTLEKKQKDSFASPPRAGAKL